MADVFISYHEKSAGELAAQIAATLEASGISCWYAKRDIPTGGDFARCIPRQIKACKVFLLILNENAQHSKHIESELGLAFSRSNLGEEITIFPVEIGDFDKEAWIKYYLIHVQILKAPVLDAEHMQELAQRVAKLLNRAPQTLKSPEVQPLPVEIIKRGKCGNNVTYTLDKSGVLTISGRGAMRDFQVDDKTDIFNTPWWDNRAMISHAEIQNGVTSVGDFAFSDCAGLRSITIPDSVTTIGTCAFMECNRLTGITIPDSVTIIGEYAFMGCFQLTVVSVPPKLNISDAFFPSPLLRIERRA